jgi:hypothetical protein
VWSATSHRRLSAISVTASLLEDRRRRGCRNSAVLVMLYLTVLEVFGAAKDVMAEAIEVQRRSETTTAAGRPES